jgi:hypothetical protein
MDRQRLLQRDSVRVGVLAGLGLALGVYSVLATVLISKDGVFYIGQAQVFSRAPLAVAQRQSAGYPALLWLAHAAAGAVGAGDSVFSWIHVSQGVTLVCRVLTLIVLYLLGRLLIGGPRAFWAVLILLVLPYLAESGHDVLRDWPALLFLALGLWLLYWAVQRRAWWVFGLVGLAAAAGCLIQPTCAQLVFYALLALAVVGTAKGHRHLWRLLGAAVLLVAGFAGPVLPYMYVSGAVVPRQWMPPKFNSAPMIASVGGQGASNDALEFEVRQGELLEIAIEASDPQGDKLAVSLASIPVGSRPVYRLRLTASNSLFATISEDEMTTLLEIYPPGVARYEGISYYAYARPDARPGLEPVHRFWSAVQQRHFYTIDPSEKDEIAAESSNGVWTYEGIAFYAFVPGRQPPDTTPIRRLWSDRAGYLWTAAVPGREAAPAAEANAVDDGVAWYANVGGPPPAGMTLDGMTLRWQPGPGQQGDYQLNIIVSDGHLETCHLVRIKVTAPAAASSSSLAPTNPQLNLAGVASLPGSADRLFDAVAEDLMIFFFLPWGLGLYHRLRYEADRLERVLTPAIIAVNVALVLARDAWIGPGSTRRYCLALIALTIFYVPVGLDLIAQWLSRTVARRLHYTGTSSLPAFLILVAIGVAICLPKLFTPLYGDKRSYLTAARWLAENTRPEDVIAVPDSRLAFYARRQGLISVGDVDPRRADYIARFLPRDAKPSAPAGWSREYSLPLQDRQKRTLVIYNTHRHKG